MYCQIFSTIEYTYSPYTILPMHLSRVSSFNYLQYYEVTLDKYKSYRERYLKKNPAEIGGKQHQQDETF